MVKKICLMVVLFTCTATLFAQKGASNIRIQQQDSLLYVIYDLGTKSDISVYFSKDDGASFIGPLKNIDGDVGDGVEPGKNKLITWCVTKEMGYIDINSAKVKIVANAEQQPVVAKEKHPLEWRNLILVGASWIPETDFSYSVTYGRYKRFGYYVKFESNFKFLQTTDYDADSYNYDVFWDGTGSYSRIAGYAGGIWNFSKYAMLNLGVGYSHQTTIANTIGNQKIDYGYSGVDDLNVELGVIVALGKFSIGANILCLPTREAAVAVGGGISLGVNF